MSPERFIFIQRPHRRYGLEGWHIWIGPFGVHAYFNRPRKVEFDWISRDGG